MIHIYIYIYDTYIYIYMIHIYIYMIHIYIYRLYIIIQDYNIYIYVYRYIHLQLELHSQVACLNQFRVPICSCCTQWTLHGRVLVDGWIVPSSSVPCRSSGVSGTSNVVVVLVVGSGFRTQVTFL